MNAVDLNLFQFDYDQTWAVMFFRHDGTVLARYGTRADADGMKYNSLEGFEFTMRSVLAADKNWQPAMAAYYKDKLGPPAEYATADSIPSETIKRIHAREKDSKQSCIHCHNVYDAQRDVAIDEGEYNPAERFKYPLPENIGLVVDEETQIRDVIPESPASKVGIRRGYIKRVNGQIVHSIADIQFVLHHVSDPGRVTIETARSLRPWSTTDTPSEAASVATTIPLPAGWRESNIGWRASMYGMPPKPGLWVQAASKGEKLKLEIPAEKLALKVRGVFGKEVRQHGLKKGDMIVQFGEETDHHTEGEFHGHLRLNYYRPNAKLPLKLIRDGKQIDLTVTFANSL